MNADALQAGALIDRSAGALARWIAERHGDGDRTIAMRYGASWQDRWAADVQMRLRQLAQAVAVGRPELFAETVAWSSGLFAARAVPLDDLRTSLVTMRAVLDEHLPAPVRTHAAPALDAALARLDAAEDAAPTDELSSLEPIALQYLEAQLECRGDRALAIVADARDDGMSTTDVYERIIAPAQRQLGRLWHAGEINVAEEHAATAITDSVLGALRVDRPAPANDAPRVLVTAVDGDLHALPARIVADFFELDGWRVIYLGASTPTEDILAAIESHDVDLVALSAMNTLQVRTVGDVVARIRALGDGAPPVIVGGGPFELVRDLWCDLGADGHGATAAEAVAAGRRLVRTSRGEN